MRRTAHPMAKRTPTPSLASTASLMLLLRGGNAPRPRTVLYTQTCSAWSELRLERAVVSKCVASNWFRRHVASNVRKALVISSKPCSCTALFQVGGLSISRFLALDLCGGTCRKQMSVVRRVALPAVACLAATELPRHVPPTSAPRTPPAFTARRARADVRCAASLPGAMLAGLKKALGGQVLPRLRPIHQQTFSIMQPQHCLFACNALAEVD